MKASTALLFLGLVLVLAACGGGVATPRPSVVFVSPTAVVAADTSTPGAPAQPSDTVEPQSGATPEPAASATPQPSPTQPPATLAPTAAPVDGGQVTRIQFQTGATDAVLTGHLGASGAARYVLRASAGQIMRVSLSPDQGQVILVIYGADGDVLISDHAGSAYFTGVLPTSQDYFIDVRAAPEGAVDYTLQVVIPERIQFPAGGTTASVKGSLPPAGGHSYVLGAMAGQTMSVKLAYPSGQALIIIWGADGNVLISDHAEAQEWSGVLPTTQDYYIDVRSAANSAPVNYTLQVTIPPLSAGDPEPVRIQFKPGATSATVKDSVPAGQIDRYVLKASAGQTMSVELMNPSRPALIVIWGKDGNVLISDHAEAQEWSGVLPTTQDYYIDVHAAAGSGSAQYTLVVTIPPLSSGSPEPVRIQFKPGATSATVQGNVGAGKANRYVLGAAAGQTMSVKLTLTSGDAYLVIWGADGSVLLRGDWQAKEWSDVLTITEDYYIDVQAAGGSAARYTLQVVIPPK